MKGISLIIVSTDCFQNISARFGDLSKCNRSILEIIVVNDGTEKWPVNHPCLKVINFNGKGYCLAAARNIGASVATSSHLWFLDDDCILDTTLVKSINFLDYYGSVLFGPRIQVNKRMNARLEELVLQSQQCALNVGDEVRFGSIVENNMIIPKDTFEKLGGFVTALKVYGLVGQEFLYRLDRIGVKCLFHNELVVYHTNLLTRKGFIGNVKKRRHILLARMFYPFIFSDQFQNGNSRKSVNLKYWSLREIILNLFVSILIVIKKRI